MENVADGTRQVEFIDVRDRYPELKDRLSDLCIVATASGYKLAVYTSDDQIDPYWTDAADHESAVNEPVQGWIPAEYLYEAKNRLLDAREERLKKICATINEETPFVHLLAWTYDPALYSLEMFAKALSKDQRKAILERLRSDVKDRQFEVQVFEEVIYGRDQVKQAWLSTIEESIGEEVEPIHEALLTSTVVRNFVENRRLQCLIEAPVEEQIAKAS